MAGKAHEEESENSKATSDTTVYPSGYVNDL